MSAFTNSGHSGLLIWLNLRVRFRPLADVGQSYSGSGARRAGKLVELLDGREHLIVETGEL